MHQGKQFSYLESLALMRFSTCQSNFEFLIECKFLFRFGAQVPYHIIVQLSTKISERVLHIGSTSGINYSNMQFSDISIVGVVECNKVESIGLE